MGIVQNMDWTGLDNWTGLDWTVGLDWTDFFCNVFWNFLLYLPPRMISIDNWSEVLFKGAPYVHFDLKIYSLLLMETVLNDYYLLKDK